MQEVKFTTHTASVTASDVWSASYPGKNVLTDSAGDWCTSASRTSEVTLTVDFKGYDYTFNGLGFKSRDVL